MNTTPPSRSPGHGAQPAMMSEASGEQAALNGAVVSSVTAADSEDDLDVDLARAALDTGTEAFDAQQWDEAEALLQEALQAIQRLPEQQRAFCDLFALQYKLAICAYHAREPADAEQALTSVIQQPVSSDEHRNYLYDAAYMLSYLYIYTGQLERARSECERALQGRRRLLGKQSDASLESMALMAHIYVLLNNRARAKACLATIPEVRRDEVARSVEASLARMKSEQFGTSSGRTGSISEELLLEGQPPQSSCSESTHSLQMENLRYEHVPPMPSQPQPVSPRPSYQRSPSDGSGASSLRSVTVTSLPLIEQRTDSRSMERPRPHEGYSTYPEAYNARVVGAGESSTATAASRSRGLSRGEILRNLRCLPVDRVEEAVCSGDDSAVASLLKKSGSWRSKMQKALHSKRITALHFAALFGEIKIAHRLLSANFDINEVPELSATRQTPLKFAIGTRQMDMVAFLIGKGAKPVEPDSWPTLAGQVMDRSWLANTMSVAEREDLHDAPNRMIGILKIWLKHGWNVNAPYEASGRTLLHQAIAFESGHYKWDANLRDAMTRFLCEQGADPTKPDNKGNTPYDMAAVAEDQDLLLVLKQWLKKKELDERLAGMSELSVEPLGVAELPAESLAAVELFDRSADPVKRSGPHYGYNIGQAR